MKIASSSLDLSAQHTAVETRSVEESFRSATRRGLSAPAASQLTASSTRVTLSQASALAASIATQPSEAQGKTLDNPTRNAPFATNDAQGAGLELEIEDDPQLQMMRLAIEMLTGRKIHAFSSTLRAVGETAPGGGEIRYERHESIAEFEQTDFSAQGVVKTADGREIGFTLDISMSRAYFEENHLSFTQSGSLQDPLVLNFSGTAAQLSDAYFRFDLDSDGQEENLRALAPGSGFLVFDRNRDGKVNDGSELFGARTGDGFGELAALDGDGNGWIDENDDAWRHLYIWNKGADGQEVLLNLKDADVGAIALENVQTPFSIKDFKNQLLAQIRSTGVFLKESGGAGSVQKIDLVV
jgi:PAS domain-containing protein